MKKATLKLLLLSFLIVFAITGYSTGQLGDVLKNQIVPGKLDQK